MIRSLRVLISQSWQQFIRHLTTREYCAWASPYLQYCKNPLGVLVMTAVAALICGLLVAPQGFVVLAATVAVISIGCIWPWIGIRGVSCELKFAATRTTEGQSVDTELIISNRWPWPVWGLAVEGGLNLSEELNEEPNIAISRVGGWSRGHYNWKFTPAVRGRYPATCPHLVTEFPFGLWKAKKQVEVSSRLIAWPLRFALPAFTLPCGSQSWNGQPSECSEGSLGHRTSVRGYRHGDSMRQIHWAKTALYDKLVSYEREGLAISDATIMLDTQPGVHLNAGPQSTLEWSIRIAASICETLIRQGVGVTVVAHTEAFQSLSKGTNPSILLDWFALLNTGSDGTPRSVRRSCSPRASTGLTFHITTDLAKTTASDSIVLLTEANDSCRPHVHNPARCWMVLEQGKDIPSQVRSSWRNGPRRVRYAS